MSQFPRRQIDNRSRGGEPLGARYDYRPADRQDMGKRTSKGSPQDRRAVGFCLCTDLPKTRRGCQASPSFFHCSLRSGRLPLMREGGLLAPHWQAATISPAGRMGVRCNSAPHTRRIQYRTQLRWQAFADVQENHRVHSAAAVRYVPTRSEAQYGSVPNLKANLPDCRGEVPNVGDC